MKIAITDPISSGSLLARRAKELGHIAVELRTFDAHSEYYTRGYDPSIFESTIEYNGDDAAAVHALRDVDRLIVGADSGVAVTERLKLYRGELKNDPNTILARSDKVEQSLRFSAAGLSVVPQAYFTVTEIDGALRFARSRGFPGRPMVLKPRASGGTNNVKLVATNDEFLAGFHSISRATSLYTRPNGGAIVMDYLHPADADEFVVDAVSAEGEHFITDIWRYEKEPLNGTPAMYRSMHLVPFEDARGLTDYSRGLLDAAGYRQGASHAEVWRTKSGFFPVEVGFRLPGLITRISADATGRDQIDLTLDAMLEPEGFLRFVNSSSDLSLRRAASVIFLASPKRGTLRGPFPAQDVKRLPSFHSMAIKAVHIGDAYDQTVDVATIAGWVGLLHHDPDIIAKDIAVLREIETQLYR
jgi:ATP-grasp domain